jgi:hypothetical protein
MTTLPATKRRPPSIENWAALAEHAAAIRRSRVVREERAGPRCLVVSTEQAGAYRRRAMHLVARLAEGSHSAAAFAGLQDSAPRAGLLSMHARQHGIHPEAWEDDSLAQIWFRWADYLVPKDALAAFTLGAAPRSADFLDAAAALADSVAAALGGQALTQRQLTARLPDVAPIFLRSLSVTGRIRIRWDASRLVIYATETPAADPEEARLELARRFLTWHGPANAAHFAKWAGLGRSDAELTWRRLASELLPVSLAGRHRWMLARHEQRLRLASEDGGVRLLPLGDPYRYLDEGLALPTPPDLHDRVADPRQRNALSGRLLLNGRVVGSWSRAAGNVRLVPWRPMNHHELGLVEQEVAALSGPIRHRLRLEWR